MNTRGGSVVKGSRCGWARATLTHILTLTILIVPLFLLVENCHCVGGTPSDLTSQVTAHHDPTWKSGTKRTTPTQIPSQNKNENQNKVEIPRFNDGYTQPLVTTNVPKYHRRQHSLPQINYYNNNNNYNYNNNFDNYNVNNTYFPVPVIPAPYSYPYPFPYPPVQQENENTSQQISLAPNKIKRRKRLRRPSSNNTIAKRQSPLMSFPPRGLTASSSTSSVASLEHLYLPENPNSELNARRKNRRRRLTRRKKIKNRYFRPQHQNLQEFGHGNSEIEPENLLSSASLEPYDGGYSGYSGYSGYGYNNPVIGFESLQNSNQKFQATPSPLVEPEVAFEQTPQQKTKETEVPEVVKPTVKPTTIKAGSSRRPPILMPRRPNSGNNIVIYQRGTPNTPNYHPPTSPGNFNLGTTPIPIPHFTRRRKMNRNRNRVANSNSNSKKETENFEDLNVGESFNPFLNSSTPISNDLRNSLYTNLELNLLHPLFSGSADATLKDTAKIPENKTIGIKHTLSDSPVSVRVAPDLHMDFKSQHSLLNDRDSIISSDYERQVYKSRPRIEVKTSVSMSTSTTVSSPTTNRKSTTNNLNHHNNNKNVSIQSHGHKSTTPMPPTTTLNGNNNNVNVNSENFSLNSKTGGTRSSTAEANFSGSKSGTTSKPMITLEDMFTLFPNAAQGTGPRSSADVDSQITDNNSVARPTKATPFTIFSSSSSGDGTTGNSRATTYKPSFFSSSIFEAGSSLSTSPTRPTLPLTTFAQMRGKATVPTTTTTISPFAFTLIENPTSIAKTKTPFTLRPKDSNDNSQSQSQGQSSTARTKTTVTPTPTTLSLTFPTVAPTTTNTHNDKINTFLDSIDESAGKNTWTPTQKPNLSETSTRSTTRRRNRTQGTRRPTEKIKINKDPPLILIPPFTNDKEEPKPVTLTTPEPITTNNNNNNNLDADSLLLKQLLGELGISGADLDILSSTSRPPPSTTVKKPGPVESLEPVTKVKTTTTTSTTSTTVTTPPPTTTTRKPTTKRVTTPPPRLPPTTQADLFNLFNLFAPQTNAPQNQNQRPATATTAASNDLFNLLNLFQPSTPSPRQQATNLPNNDLFNLFNLFQPQTAPPVAATTQRPQTLPPPPPPPAQSQGGLNDLFNIFNLFTTPSPVHLAPQTTTARKPPPPPVTAAPVANDILGLLNLLQPQSTNQNQNQLINQNQQQKPGNANPQADLEALVQQALFESLGLNGAGGGLAGLGGLNLFGGQATNLNHQLINPSISPGAIIPSGTGNNGLSDADLKSIYALIDQQKPGSNSSDSSVDGSSGSTTNNNGTQTASVSVVNSISLKTTPPPSSTAAVFPSQSPGSVFNNNQNSNSNSTATTINNENDILLQLINANSNSNSNSNQKLNASASPSPLPPLPTETTKLPSKKPTADPSLDILSQLLNLGQVVENTKTASSNNPVRTVKESGQSPNPFLQLTQQKQKQPALDLQSLLAQSWLVNSQNQNQNQIQLTSPKPEVAPSESNLFNIFANQFTPRPQRPNGLYYWVDLNAFMGEQGGNPVGGIRPKLGQKDYFLKVKRDTTSDEKISY